MTGGGLMESTAGGVAVNGGVAVLSLGACTETGLTKAGGEPALRFSSPADNGSASRDERGDPVRVRRDAYGRPIQFREVPLDPPGVARGSGNGQVGVFGEQTRCTDGADHVATRGSVRRIPAPAEPVRGGHSNRACPTQRGR